MDETKNEPVTVEAIRDWWQEGCDVIADTIAHHKQRADAAVAALVQARDHARELEEELARKAAECTAYRLDLDVQRRYAEAVEKQLGRVLDKALAAR